MARRRCELDLVVVEVSGASGGNSERWNAALLRLPVDEVERAADRPLGRVREDIRSLHAEAAHEPGVDVVGGLEAQPAIHHEVPPDAVARAGDEPGHVVDLTLEGS